MKIAYMKNGDAVDQCRRLLPNLDHPVRSGIDAFIYDFLSNNRSADILVLSRGFLNDVYQYNRVKAKTYTGKARLKIFQPLIRFWATVLMFVDIVRFKPDRIICGSSAELLVACYIASKLLRVPLVHSRHNLLPEPDPSYFKSQMHALERYVIRNIEANICHGPYLEAQLKAVTGSSGRVIEFDVGFDPPAELAKPQENDCKNIVYVGRVEKPKGIFDLLNAFESVCKEFNTKLIVLGDGTALDQLREQVKQKQLESYVEVVGRKPHAEVMSILNRSAIVVCPSRREFPEGRCMSAMEALVNGVPVVAPEYGPFPYLVENEYNGLLYTVNSVSAMGDAIRSLLKNDELYDRVCEGARLSGKQLITPLRTFNEALELGFSGSKQGTK